MSHPRHTRGWIVLAVGVVLWALAWSRGPSLTPLIAHLHPRAAWIERDALAPMLADESPPLLLDVRTHAEIVVSTLPGAIAHDPAQPLPRERLIVVYCSLGWRSAAVAEDLAAEGYDARNLEGGIFAWANEGRAVVRGDASVTQVHPFDRLWAYWLDDRLEAWSAD